ncbi:sulfate adenylyltransferase subunit 1 (EFTu-like GTPase family) [Bradyrhizobium sp. USDA 4518]
MLPKHLRPSQPAQHGEYRAANRRRSGIVASYLAFAAGLGFTSIVPIPISARYIDNAVDRSAHD